MAAAINLRGVRPKAMSELVTAELALLLRPPGGGCAPAWKRWLQRHACPGRTQAVVLQACWLSLVSALAVTPPSVALAGPKLQREGTGSYLSLRAESRVSLWLPQLPGEPRASGISQGTLCWDQGQVQI